MRRFAKYILAMLVAVEGYFPLHAQTLSNDERLERLKALDQPALHESGKCLSFETKVIDAGTIKEDGQPVEYIFRWKNISDSSLTITTVTTGCSCAVPVFRPQTVAPGQVGEIKVTYHPKGHPGNFSRKFSVYTDLSGSQPAVVLLLKGYVEPAALPTWNYPVAMGDLLLKRSKVELVPGKVQTERILCLNAGNRELTISAMNELLPSGVTVVCEPSVIQPGCEADIVIRYKPSSVNTWKNIPVILEGLDLPPSKRRIDIYFKDEQLR